MDAHHASDEGIGFAKLRFGAVSARPELDAFRGELNRELIDLMQSLPAVLHADTVVFFLHDLKIAILPQFDYFRNYFTPAWSIVFWLERLPVRTAPLAEADRQDARTAHAMALFLHLLDDHLNDGQLQASHLALLLRSQAWRRMHQALEGLRAGVATGAGIVEGALEAYYGSIGAPPAPATLEGYCAHFRDQMATGTIVPLLMASKMGYDKNFDDALVAAYGGFGVAWRLLDDWQDLEEDMRSGCRSAVYFAAPADIRRLWDGTPAGDPADRHQKIRTLLHRYGIGDLLKQKINAELTVAAATLERIHLAGLAEELRCLAGPLSAERAPA
jgi:hypothetical protein